MKTVIEHFNVSGWKAETIPAMQVAVYTMCGGGRLGRFAAEQPEKFYVDARVGKLPYKKQDIYQAVKILIAVAKENGIDPANLPEIPKFHNMGFF